MLGQDVELVLHHGRLGSEQIARVGVLRHQPQRLFLAASAHEDPRPWPLDGAWLADRLSQAVMPALIRTVVVAPHLLADLQRLLETLEPLSQGRKGDTEASV